MLACFVQICMETSHKIASRWSGSPLSNRRTLTLAITQSKDVGLGWAPIFRAVAGSDIRNSARPITFPTGLQICYLAPKPRTLLSLSVCRVLCTFVRFAWILLCTLLHR